MSDSTSCLVLTPRMLKKGAAGILLSRALSRSGLELAGARVLALTEAEAGELADLFTCPCGRLAAYIRREFAPAADGRPAVYDPNPATAKVLGRAHNMTEGLNDATAHAEMLALSSSFASKGNWRLSGARLYVTKEPCPMCAGAIVLSRVAAVVWGVDDPKRGGGTVFNVFAHPGINHHPEIVRGVLEAPSRAVLQDFFRKRRD